MTSIKVKFRPSSVPDHEGTIYYQIIHERKVRQIVTDYHVFSYEWDAPRSILLLCPDTRRYTLLLSVREHIRRDMERINRICRKLESARLPYSADYIISEFNRYASEYTLFGFMETIIANLRINGNIRTSETYRAALNSFRTFIKYRVAFGPVFSPNEDIMLDSLNSELMEAYEAWLRQKKLSPNTISFYTRILRAVYNRAVEQDIIENRFPFRHVYTGVGKTVKRALPLTVIKQIKATDLSMNPSLDFARDMFIMSFYLRGMSFVDMTYLRKSDLRNGYVTYRRRKTGQLLAIKWTTDMQSILDKYPENESDYLLPIITSPGLNERCTYRNMSYNINRNLNKFAKLLNLGMRLTMYVARHSWASAAKEKGIPVTVISEGLGHDNEATTRIYLSSLDTSVIDHANSLILKSLE